MADLNYPDYTQQDQSRILEMEAEDNASLHAELANNIPAFLDDPELRDLPTLDEEFIPPARFDDPWDLEGYIENAAGAPPFPTEALPRIIMPGDPDDNADDIPLPHQHVFDAIDAHVAQQAYLNANSLKPGDLQGDGISPYLGMVPTADEHAQQLVQDALNDDERQRINQNTLIFEYGPFFELEANLRDLCQGEFSGRTNELVVSHIRQAIHDAVAPAHKKLALDENTEDGLRARISALDLIESNLKTELTPLMRDLKDAGVDQVDALYSSLSGAVRTERTGLAGKLKGLTPPTIGGILFQTLRSALRTNHADGLVGNARKHRNRELTTALQNMYTIGAEIKENSGHADWEKSQGRASLKELALLSSRIRGMTRGVEDQVDSLALRKGYTDIQKMLVEASAKSVDPEHKSSLDSLNEQFQEFIKYLSETLSKLFTNPFKSRRPD